MHRNCTEYRNYRNRALGENCLEPPIYIVLLVPLNRQFTSLQNYITSFCFKLFLPKMCKNWRIVLGCIVSITSVIFFPFQAEELSLKEKDIYMYIKICSQHFFLENLLQSPAFTPGDISLQIEFFTDVRKLNNTAHKKEFESNNTKIQIPQVEIGFRFAFSFKI